jgi:hypothetical protein
MYQRFWITYIIGLLLLFGGCGGENVTQQRPPAVSSAAPGTTPFEANADSIHSATDVVSKFMAAMIRGESQTIRMLLTPLARQKGEEKGIPFASEASDTALFTIDKAVPQGENSIYVHTTLTDLNEKSEKESVEIVWIVTKNEEGWRVAGAAVSLLAGQDKTLINFEDPEAAQNAISLAVVNNQ